jgi:hypothetical protein
MAPRDFKERMERLREIVWRRLAEYDARHRRRFPRRQLGILGSNDPQLSTVLRGAHDLETTVGDLLEEPPLGEADIQKLREFVEFLIARFDLMGTQAATARAAAHTLAIPESEFIERDFDYPRPHHVWIVPHAKAAAGSGIEADRDTEMTEVLHSIRDVYNGQLRVIRVNGESMSPVLRDGDKVTFDTRLVTPQDGDVVAVYDSVRGGMVGYWRSGANGECWLDKENDAFVAERLDAAGGWTLWGTVTRRVDTPVHPRRPHRR